MGAYEGLSNYLNKSLCDYALPFGYDASNILIFTKTSYLAVISPTAELYREWSKAYRILDI